MIIIEAALFFVNAIFFLLVAVFSVEVLASVVQRGRPTWPSGESDAGVVVLIPAHQEEIGIGDTVAALLPQLKSTGRVLVVADNCTDETAVKAAAAGAEIVIRSDATHRGKGYALDHGIRHLEENPPSIVIVLDADCVLEPGAIARLAVAASMSGRPVQGLNLMSVPPGGRVSLQVAQLAFLIKNLVRPLGLKRLGLPCHLTGTGMAFPWEVVRNVNLATGSLAEDMKLGLELALAGHPPIFCPAARINSHFPYSKSGAASQRSRWEEGHLTMIGMALSALPAAFRSGNLGAIALALDVLVPPLTLLLLLVAGTAIATWSLTALFGLPVLALGVSLASLLVLVTSIAIAWLAYGRKALPLRSLPLILTYVLGKMAFYASMALGKRSRGWVRTDRSGPDE